MVIQNVNDLAANVTITYYNSNGSVYSTTTTVIAPHAIAVYSNTPGVLVGSAVVTSNRPVAVVVNLVNGAGGDGTASYTAVHR
jgi:hypothetical protein